MDSRRHLSSQLQKLSRFPQAVVDIEVPFHDIDPMEVVWHGNYFKYFELARCAVLRQINYDYPEMRGSGFAWPIVDIRSKFIAAARYSDQLQVAAVIVEWEFKLRIKYFVANARSGQIISKGYSDQVAVNIETMEMEFGSPHCLLKAIAGWNLDNIEVS